MKLFYLSILAFVFMASVSLAMIKPKLFMKPEVVSRQRGVVSLMPVLAADTQTFPVVSAQGVMAIDVASNTTMYEKNADEPLLPASTTKIMTAMVSLENYNLMGLIKGEEIKVKDLLSGLLIYSANDAAYVLADHYPTGYTGFIEAMNKKVYEYKMLNTHFENPAGLDNTNHVSTARDLVRLSMMALKDSVFSELVATKKMTVASTDGRIRHYLNNTNELLGEVAGVKGIKTGWTENARENLVTYIERDNKKVVLAVLGSQDRFGESKELINWIFGNYNWKDVSYSP